MCRVQSLHRAARLLQRQERQRSQGSAPATLQCTLGSSSSEDEEEESDDEADVEALAMKILASRRENL